jgi:hypothetical protein
VATAQHNNRRALVATGNRTSIARKRLDDCGVTTSGGSSPAQAPSGITPPTVAGGPVGSNRGGNTLDLVELKDMSIQRLNQVAKDLGVSGGRPS